MPLSFLVQEQSRAERPSNPTQHFQNCDARVGYVDLNSLVSHSLILPGLRSPVRIRKGQFIDTYRGEVITDAEATRREHAGRKGKDSYLYSLDKFRGTEGSEDFIPDSELYVVDGEMMGGPTRFINHSCDPNCRQYTVSTVRGDSKVYHLAFFAIEEIQPGEELTFDYLDKDEEEEEDEDDVLVTEENLGVMEEEKGKLATRCLCGTTRCRKYLWL